MVAGSESLVCVVVLNWNGWEHTIQCLESLLAATYRNCAVVVVDNGSHDESVAQLRSWFQRHSDGGGIEACPDANVGVAATGANERISEFRGSGGPTPRFTLLEIDRNLGFAAGVNIGAHHAIAQNADYVWLLNNDAVVSPDTLGALVRCAKEDRLDVVGSLVCEELEPMRVEFARGRLPWDLFGLSQGRTQVSPSEASWRSDWVTFASVLIARKPIAERLESQGYFLDPGLFMYVEDVDFCFYCMKAGYAVGVSSAAPVLHRRSSSSGGAGSPRVYYYITRNRIAVARRWLGPVGYAVFLGCYCVTRLVLLARHLLNRRFTVSRAVIQALADGLQGRVGIWRHH